MQVKPNTWKSWELESSGTPECSELESKGENTSHWGVLGVIGKILKRRYRKWPRIGHLDIFSPSYGQKKGRESNWQFDSRPLKVGNRCLPDIRFECATWCWKDLDEGYNSGLDLVAIGLCSRVMTVQSFGSPAGTISGLHFGSLGNLCHLDVASMASCRVKPLRGGRQQPLQSLEKLIKYKGGNMRHEMAALPSPKIRP